MRNVLVEYGHRLPVLSVLLLLAPDAGGSAINGILQRCLPSRTCYDEFRYQVIRVWELPETDAGTLAFHQEFWTSK